MSYKFLFMCMLATGLLASCTTSTVDKNNPLLSEWNTPHQTPPFNEIKLEHYKPAIEYAMKVNKDEIKAITDNSEAPTFFNTIEALERSGALLNRVLYIMENLNSADTNEGLQALIAEMTPILSDHSNDISLNEKLFERIKSVHNNHSNLTPIQQRLLDDTYESFVRRGANLTGQDRDKYRELSRKLSESTLKFEENLLAETNAYTLVITDESDLAGLPQSSINAAAATAKDKNVEGWAFTLQAPSYNPFLQYADNRQLREQIYMAYNSRGSHGNENDNREIIKEIVNTRLAIAQLLGYKTYADYVLENRMAENRETVENFLNQLLDASMPFGRKEYKEVNDYAKKHGADFDVQRWDWSYYSEKLKDEKYSINDELLRPYFKLDNVINGLFNLAKTLYGITFTPNSDIQKYNPDVKCYEVYDKDGQFLSVLYFDFFPRAGKSGGAWMTVYREAQIIDQVETRPIVSLVTNFSPPTDGKPSLLTYKEVETFLHEFGHCLHGIFAKGEYASLTGTNVYRDFVELPSQIMENFLSEAEFLNTFAVNYETGEKIPTEYLDKIKAINQYIAGYLSARQLTFGILDMAWYTLDKPFNGDVEAFESAAIEHTDLMPRPSGTILSSTFAHIFSGGYSAGYYSYKWSEVLDADAFSVFQENGIFDKATAESFRKNILEKGDSEHPMVLYKRFRGQEPTVDALLRREGFIKR